MWTEQEKDEFLDRIGKKNPEIQFTASEIFQKLNEINSAWYEKVRSPYININDEMYKVGIDAYSLGLMHLSNDKVRWIVLPGRYLDIILLPGTSTFDLRRVIVWKEDNLRYLYDIDNLMSIGRGYDEINIKFKEDQDRHIAFSVWKDDHRGLIDGVNGHEVISPI